MLMSSPFAMGQQPIGDFIVTEALAQSAHHFKMGIGKKIPDIAFVAPALAFGDHAEFFETAEVAHHGADGAEAGGKDFGQIHWCAMGLPIADKDQQLEIEAVSQEGKVVSVIVTDGFQHGKYLEQFVILNVPSQIRLGRSKGCHGNATAE